MATAEERKAARTARVSAARAARERNAKMEAIHATLGDALTASLMKYLLGKPNVEITPLERAISMIGYSDELKRLLVRCIEVNPAMEESFLKIAELAFSDGEDEVRRSSWDYEFET